jgi:hypothetical protein
MSFSAPQSSQRVRVAHGVTVRAEPGDDGAVMKVYPIMASSLPTRARPLQDLSARAEALGRLEQGFRFVVEAYEISPSANFFGGVDEKLRKKMAANHEPHKTLVFRHGGP